MYDSGCRRDHLLLMERASRSALPMPYSLTISHAEHNLQQRPRVSFGLKRASLICGVKCVPTTIAAASPRCSQPFLYARDGMPYLLPIDAGTCP